MKRLLMVALLCLAPMTGWAQDDEEEEEKTLADRLITVVSVGGEMQFKPPPFGQVRALSLMLMDCRSTSGHRHWTVEADGTFAATLSCSHCLVYRSHFHRALLPRRAVMRSTQVSFPSTSR